VFPGYLGVSVSKQVLEDRQCFAAAPQADGITIAKHLEVAKGSDLQTGFVGDSVRLWWLVIVDGPYAVSFGSFPDLVWVCANAAEPGDYGTV